MNKIIVLTLLVLLFCSCTESTLEKRQKMLQSVSQQAIIPSFSKLSQEADKLNKAINNLTLKSTEVELHKAQEAWKATAKAWQYCQAFNLGNYKENFIHNRIGTCPTKLKTLSFKIEQAKGQIDSSFIDSIGSNNKGLCAIEHFLFDKSAQTQLKTSEKHLAFTKALAQNLKTQTQLAASIWTADQKNFIHNTQVDINSSMSLLANEVIRIVQKIHIHELARPMMEDKKVNLEKFLAHKSQYTKELLIAQLEGIKKIFDNGLSEYIDAVATNKNKELSQKISTRLNNTLTQLKALDKSIEEAAISDMGKLFKPLEELRQLLILLKVDTANTLGISLTFSDNDGD